MRKYITVQDIKKFTNSIKQPVLNKWYHFTGNLEVCLKWSNRYQKSFLHIRKRIRLIVKAPDGKTTNLGESFEYYRIKDNSIMALK